jgi:hypothetical protein
LFFSEFKLADFSERGFLVLVLELDIFFPKVNITLAKQQPAPKKLLYKVVVVLYDNVAQNAYALNHLLLKNGRDQDSLDDQFLEKGQVFEGLKDFVDLLVGEEVVRDFLCRQDLGVTVFKVLVLVRQVLEVVVSAFLDFLNHEPFQPVEFAHHESQVVALHLRAYVLFDGVNLHEEHGEKLVFGVQTVHDHGYDILQNEVLLISKVINSVNGPSCQCGKEIIKVEVGVVATEVGFYEFEHFGQDAVDFFDLLLLVFFLKHFVLEPTRLYHRYLPHLDHGYGLANQLDVLD